METGDSKKNILTSSNTKSFIKLYNFYRNNHYDIYHSLLRSLKAIQKAEKRNHNAILI